MNNIEIKNKFDLLLKQLSTERSFDIAEKISAELIGLLNIKTTDRFLVNIPRVDAELTRFQLAPGFARQAAAYELPHEDGKPLDLKLFWIKKASKTNLSWLIGLTPNFEDALSNDYKNIGIDFVVPETCDSIIVLLSNRFKVRALELKDHITPTQLEIFAQWVKLGELEIEDQNELKNSLHTKLWESFNFEPINRKFYLELVEHFSILVHHLEKTFERKLSVMFTTRLIGRLLFIWFLKKKNLVNADIDYFIVPDPEKQIGYYKNHLEKLFFEVLNRDELERSNGDKITPYLNGGLFDKSGTDFYNDPKLTFPNGYFNQLFNTLNKYNFTVDESSPEFQHVAIDPEMLGRIFESLLAEQIDENTGNSKKKATGAFYTPREIVSYMCEQSLIEYLKVKVPDSPDRDRRLDELVRMPEAIFRDQDQNKRRDWKPYRESIIKALEGTKTESALTVLDPAVGSGAFPMGMLHLLVKIYSRLDSKFEKNVSGLKRDILSRSLYGIDIEQTAIEITRLRAWLSIIVDIPEGEKVEPLPNLEFKFVCANTLIPLDDTKQATFFTDHDLKDKLITIRNDYFRTSSKTKKEKLQKEYLKLTPQEGFFDNKKTKQLKSYRPFDIGSSSEFYDSELMHGVESFNIVLGNPPYISAVTMARSVSIKKVYKTLYPLATGSYDIYILFLLKALELTNKEGIYTWIIPNKFLISDYAKKCKKLLVDKYGLIKSIDVSSFKVFKETGVYPVIISGIKSFKGEFKELTLSAYEDLGQQLFKEVTNLKIHKTFKEFGIKLYSGTTGFQANQIKPFIKTDKLLDSIPFVVSGSIDRYYWINKNVRYMGKKYDTAFISKNNFIANSKWQFWNNEKIIIAGMTKVLESVYSAEPVALGVGIYGIYDFAGFEPKCLNGLLNSKYMTFYFQQKFKDKHLAGGYLGINKSTIEELPLVDIKKEEQSKISNIVDQILVIKKQNKDADTKQLESQIDQLVYKLYDLKLEEIAIVEYSSK